jgi:natural product precursor
MKKMKRLKLNRETIARLGHETLTEVKGGTGADDMKCTGCPSGCGIFEEQQLGGQ